MIYILLKRDTIGLNNDAKTVEKFLKHPCQIILKTDLDNVKHPDTLYAKIMIENIDPEFVKINSEKTVFIPNPEFLSEWDVKYLDTVDYIWCKSQFCYDYFSEILKQQDIKPAPKLVYTKFTSPAFSHKKSKNYNLACHFAGTSFMKSTKALIQTWVKNKGFTEINPDLNLLITLKPNPRTNYIYKWIQKNCDSKETVTSILGKRLGQPVVKYTIGNIHIVDFLSTSVYKHFRDSAGYFICPSEVEGYGHYINEGRIAAAITLTTDHPPMNELITDKRTLLKIKTTKKFGEVYPFVKYLFNNNYPIAIFDTANFATKFKKLLKMPNTDKYKIQQKNYDNFTADTKFFEKAINDII